MAGLDDARDRVLTPRWIRERDSRIQAIASDPQGIARLAGVQMALLDHARHHMPAEEWQYILDELDKELER